MPFRIDYGVEFINLETDEKFHSYYDLGLNFVAKTIDLPKKKRHTVKTDRYIHDFTKDMYERDVYENRNITIDFMFLGAYENWEEVLGYVTNKIHGKNMEFTFDTGDYYYRGYCEINDFKTNRSLGTISISIDAEPYRYEPKKTSVKLTTLSYTSGSRSIEVPDMSDGTIEPMNDVWFEVSGIYLYTTSTVDIKRNGRGIQFVRDDYKKKFPIKLCRGDMIDISWKLTTQTNNDIWMEYRKVVL